MLVRNPLKPVALAGELWHFYKFDAGESILRFHWFEAGTLEINVFDLLVSNSGWCDHLFDSEEH